MSRPDEPVEPSMEEILASIRKIIAEEPIGTRPAPSDEKRASQVPGHGDPRAEPALGSALLPPAARRRAPTPGTVALDDMLDLGQSGGLGPAGHQGPDPAKPVHPAARPPRSSPDGSSAGLAVTAARGDAADSTTSAQTSPQREMNGHTLVESSDGSHAGKPPEEVPLAVPPSSDADAALSEARAKIERHLGKPAGIAERPLVPGLKSIRDADFRGVKSEAVARAGVDGLMTRVAAAGTVAEPPMKGEPAAPLRSEGADAAATVANVPTAARGEAGKATETPDATADAGAGTFGQAPAALAEDQPVPTPSAAAAKAAASAGGDKARTFEDAVAEMLRPMLREWLDANLPRLVQEALREEMAKSPLPGKDDRGG